MKIPKNIIKTGKYTSGGEFYFKITQAPYSGYYYILNNLYYAGKEYNEKAPEIVKIQQTNNMLFRSSTAIFSSLSGITSQMLKSPKITSVQPNTESNLVPERYFSSQINIKPTIIKEISKDTYDSLQGNSLYQTTFIGPTQSINQAEKQLPGLKAFLEG
jgi:hypothetical protein